MKWKTMKILQKFGLFTMLIVGMQTMTLQGAAIENQGAQPAENFNSFKEQFQSALLELPINVETIENILAKEYFYKNGMKVGFHNSTLFNELYSEYFPLHKAVENNDIGLVKLFIYYGADVNAQDDDGDTPLHCSTRSNNNEIAEFLIAQGADVNAGNDFGMTPLHWAAYNNNNEIAHMLIDADADVNAQNNNKLTPYHYAFINGSINVIRLLINAGADINI